MPSSKIIEPGRDSRSLKICVLASGSKGNTAWISDGTTTILIDAGLSGREIERRLQLRNLSAASVDAILVSHEHLDHISGVGVLARRYGIPVYITPATLAAASSAIGKIKQIRHFRSGTAFLVGGLQVHPFSISHDAADPCGFTVSANGQRIGIATDLGIPTAMVRTHLKACDLVLLEANHDPEMLITGPYPWHLKQRIKGRTGHLSNLECKALLADILCHRLRHVILGHLSEKNNLPEIALRTVSEALPDTRVQIHAANQADCGALITLNETPPCS